MATIDQVKVTDAKFPDAKPEQLEKLKTFLNTEMAGVEHPHLPWTGCWPPWRWWRRNRPGTGV